MPLILVIILCNGSNHLAFVDLQKKTKVVAQVEVKTCVATPFTIQEN